MQNNEIKKLLIIRLSALGDTIHTLPLVNAIRKQYPNIQLDWVVEDKAEKFVVNNPLINNVYVLERKKWKKLNPIKRLQEFFKIINKIKQEKYDVVIDTQQLLKSSIIMGLSNATRKISLDGGRECSWIFANEIIKTNRKQFDINYHVVKRNLEIAEYLGCKDLSVEFVIPDFSNEYSQNIKDIISNLDKTKKTIMIAPATTWDNKHWTVNGWVDVINAIKDEYNIILTATEKEKVLINKILEQIQSNNIINLAGMTTLSDIVYISKNVDLVVSPDSGSAHVAWASNHAKILTLFFATSANRTAPFGDKYYSVSADISCSPCMKKHCKLKGSNNKCIDTIKSKEIINIIKNVLQ